MVKLFYVLEISGRLQRVPGEVEGSWLIRTIQGVVITMFLSSVSFLSMLTKDINYICSFNWFNLSCYLLINFLTFLDGF